MCHMKKNNAITFTAFELRVFEAALTIPFGEVRSYQWIANQIGSSRAVRAVGSVLRKNSYPFLIPCHRVVKSNGDIGQYSGGKKIKAQLIQFEQRLKNSFVRLRRRRRPWSGMNTSSASARCRPRAFCVGRTSAKPEGQRRVFMEPRACPRGSINTKMRAPHK